MSKRANAWMWRDYVRDRARPAEVAQTRGWPYDRRVRAFTDDVLRPAVVRMLAENPEVLWMILNYWGFGPESYASESDRRKWNAASHRYNLTDADATAALLALLGEIATERDGVWFLKDE